MLGGSNQINLRKNTRISLPPLQPVGGKLQEYDAFISYDKSVQDKVTKLYNTLLESFELTLYLDSPTIEMTMKHKYKKLLRLMLRAKFFICCLNRDYIKSHKCRDELALAYTSSKPMLLLMFENLAMKELDPIIYVTINTPRIAVYEYINNKHTWSAPLVAEIVMHLQSVLNRKLLTKNDRRRAIFLSYGDSNMPVDDDRSVIEEKNSEPEEDESSKLEKLRSIDTCGTDYDNMFIDSAKINFCLLKQNSIFDLAFGYNRMAYLESRQRLLITSAYSKSIISVDRAGNWIERRNPGRMLKQPWAICINMNNEIFIGDNALKCILVFDQYFKYIKTFARNLLNSYFDMVIDDETGQLYAINLYDSVAATIDIENDVIIDRLFISTPLFIRLLPKLFVVLSADDTLYILEKQTNEMKYKFEIKNSKYLSALFTYKANVIFITGYEMLFDKTKSKNVFLCVIKLEEGVVVKKLCLDINQVNDMFLMKNSMITVDDTHVSLFGYDDIDDLIKWK